MTEEMKRETIRMYAAGFTAESVAASMDVSVEEVEEVKEAEALQIAAQREEMERAGYFIDDGANA